MKVKKKKAGVGFTISNNHAGNALGWMTFGRDRLGNFVLKIGPDLLAAIEELRRSGFEVKVERCELKSRGKN